MEKFTFSGDSFTCNGKSFPARYVEEADGSIAIYTSTENAAGKEIRVRFTPDHPDFSALKTAAHTDAAGAEPAAPQAQEITEAEPAATEEIPDGKRTRGPVPEKTFINDSIQGKGWRIYFDGNTARTRIIFDADPKKAARAAVEKAGFYFSAAMNSWNKKLTFKAYRAALAVSAELAAIYA